MGQFLEFLAKYFGMFLNFIYNTIAFQNYGIALIIFTVLVKLALLPLTIKQYRSTAKMQAVQPILKEIQARYKNDKEKLNSETMKIYQEHGVNPMGGCLPMLIQMPILFALFYVIRRPVFFVLGMSKEIIGKQIYTLYQSGNLILDKVPEDTLNELLLVAQDNFAAFYDAIIKKSLYVEVGALNALRNAPEMIVDGMKSIDLMFLKIFNLGVVPSYKIAEIQENLATYIPLLILVLIAAATTFFSSKITMAKQDTSNQSDQASAMGKNMMYFGPIMTLWIAFIAPAGLALYWTISNGVQLAQQLYINKHVIEKDKVEREKRIANEKHEKELQKLEEAKKGKPKKKKK